MTKQSLLPGLLLIEEFAESIKRSVRTIERAGDRGEVVIRYIGNTRLIDVEATAALVKGITTPRARSDGDRPMRRRRAPLTSPRG